MRTMRLTLASVATAMVLAGFAGVVTAQQEAAPGGAIPIKGAITLTYLGVQEVGAAANVDMTNGMVLKTDVTASDARATGEGTTIVNTNSYRLTDEAKSVGPSTSLGSVRLSNKDGAWSGTRTAFGSGPAAFGTAQWWLTGEGAYDGLSLIVHETSAVKADGARMSVDFEGWLLPTGWPSVPDTIDPATRFTAQTGGTASLADVVASEGVTIDQLVAVDLGPEAIPADLAGMLFFRKEYPTDQKITYGEGFIPPNTYLRYVESGKLGITPASDLQVVRSGSDWAQAETSVAGKEVVVGPGDTFVQADLPYEKLGSEALGTMDTPEDTAKVVGFAIRENGRCCKMTHPGLVSAWHVTLAGPGVQEMHGKPVTVRLAKVALEPGASFETPAGMTPWIGYLESGTITAQLVSVDPAGSVEGAQPHVYPTRTAVYPLASEAGQVARYTNTSDQPAVMYELMIEPAA